MGRFFKMYGIFTKQFLKVLLEYRADFLIGFVSFIIQQLAGLTFIYIILEQIPSLDGWDFNQLVFIYGLYLIPRGIDHTLSDNLWSVGPFIKSGDLDKYLIRPLNTLYQIVVERIDWNGVAELALGIVVVSMAAGNLDLQLHTWVDKGVFAGYILMGVIIYFSIKLFFASLSFKTKNSFAIMASGYSVSEYAKYPLTIYPTIIKIMVTFIIPFAFTSYFPAEYVLGINKDIGMFGVGWLVTLGLVLLSQWTWRAGLKSYESAGS